MNEVFLGIIAAGVAIMAAIQVRGVIVASRLARRVDRLVTEIEQEVKPVFRNLNAVTSDAARVAALAATQVERADRLFLDLAHRVDQTLTTLQTRVLGPARGGMAILAGLRAALAALRDVRDSGRKRPAVVEEEDALFIG